MGNVVFIGWGKRTEHTSMNSSFDQLNYYI